MGDLIHHTFRAAAAEAKQTEKCWSSEFESAFNAAKRRAATPELTAYHDPVFALMLHEWGRRYPNAIDAGRTQWAIDRAQTTPAVAPPPDERPQTPLRKLIISAARSLGLI